MTKKLLLTLLLDSYLKKMTTIEELQQGKKNQLSISSCSVDHKNTHLGLVTFADASYCRKPSSCMERSKCHTCENNFSCSLSNDMNFRPTKKPVMAWRNKLQFSYTLCHVCFMPKESLQFGEEPKKHREEPWQALLQFKNRNK